MNAISIWQPHASLAVIGVKPYETRSWKVPKALIGTRVWIHAAKALDDVLELAEYQRARTAGAGESNHMDAIIAALFGANFKTFADLPLGCIVGSAILESCCRTADIAEPGPFGDFSEGRYGWRMAHPRPLEVPFPIRGQQGFFRVADALLAPHAD